MASLIFEAEIKLLIGPNLLMTLNTNEVIMSKKRENCLKKHPHLHGVGQSLEHDVNC